jgi:hypothetical protein
LYRARLWRTTGTIATSIEKWNPDTESSSARWQAEYANNIKKVSTCAHVICCANQSYTHTQLAFA